MRELFDDYWAETEGMSYRFDPNWHEVGTWIFELTYRLETGELFKGFSAFNDHINPYRGDAPIPTEQEAYERVRLHAQEFITPSKRDPNHAGFPPPCLIQIKGFVIAKGYRDERSYKVECNIAVPFGEPIPEFKELTPEEQCIPEYLMSSMPW